VIDERNITKRTQNRAAKSRPPRAQPYIVAQRVGTRIEEGPRSNSFEGKRTKKNGNKGRKKLTTFAALALLVQLQTRLGQRVAGCPSGSVGLVLVQDRLVDLGHLSVVEGDGKVAVDAPPGRARAEGRVLVGLAGIVAGAPVAGGHRHNLAVDDPELLLWGVDEG